MSATQTIEEYKKYLQDKIKACYIGSPYGYFQKIAYETCLKKLQELEATNGKD